MDQSILQLAGAMPQKQPRFVPLGTHRIFTGLVKSRSPLQEPGTRAESRFYGGRPDALWDGQNIELSVDNTLIRRPGHSLVCTLPLPPQSFYTYQAPLRPINVLADTGIGNILQNPDFANQATGWNLATGWSIASGVGYGGGTISGPNGETYVGQFSGTAPAAITNDRQVPCAQGQNVTATCQIYGVSGASTGYALVRLNFFTSNGALISNVPAVQVTASSAWVTSSISATAPANSAYATVDCAVYPSGSGAPWQVSNFTVGNAGYVFNITSGNPTAVFTKAGGAGQTYFQTVGSQVFMSDGVDLLKWDGTHLWYWGIAAPTNAPSLTFGSGSYTITSVLGVSYVYCFQNNYTDHVSTASPISAYTGPQTNTQITLSGQGSTDPQVTNVQIYRTTDGGAIYYLLATIANPGSGTWSYTDTGTPDANLNTDIIAPQALANNPPPVGLQNLAFFAGCIWGSVGNYLYFSNGPLTTNGSGNESWPPLNYALLPSKITCLVPYPNGMLIFTVDDLYYITGPGATPILFQAGLGTLSYNNVDINGSTIYVFTTDGNVVAITPGAGSLDLGFNIATLFSGINGAQSYLTYHISGHADNALFLCDGNGNFWRCNPNQQPEGGAAWSPAGNIAAGAGAMVSVEATTGVHKLYVASGNNVLFRDWTSSTDNGVAYDAWAVFGSLVLALPGQLCEIQAITLEAVRVGTMPQLSVLLGEISGDFENLPNAVNDPPQLPESQTLYSKRFYLNQSTLPVVCRHMQFKVDFGADTVQNELLGYALFGALHTE